MKILNKQIYTDIENQKLLNLNVGSGGGVLEGYYSVDIENINGKVDIIADLNEPLHLIPDNSVKNVYSCHVFEHIKNLTLLMSELHRITHPSGLIEIRVPHFSNPYYYSDPTHERFFGVYSMNYYVETEDQPSIRKVPSFYIEERFIIEKIKITLLNNSLIDRIIFPRMFNFINKNFERQDLYERRLCRIFPASGLIFLIRPKK